VICEADLTSSLQVLVATLAPCNERIVFSPKFAFFCSESRAGKYETQENRELDIKRNDKTW
jgi:hypothetical protein